MISNDTTLASIATAIPGAAGILRRNKLDFCCRGQQTLADACAARGVDLDRLLGELEALDRSKPAPLEEAAVLLVLVLHHGDRLGELERHPPRCCREEDLLLLREVRIDLPRAALEELREAVRAIRALAVPFLHPPREREQILKRRPERLMVSTLDVRDELGRAERGERFEDLRAVAHDFDPPAGACNSWRALYLGLADLEKELHEHILIENHLLFSRLGGRASPS